MHHQQASGERRLKKIYQLAAQASGFPVHSLAHRACRLVNSHAPLALRRLVVRGSSGCQRRGIRLIAVILTVSLTMRASAESDCACYLSNSNCGISIEPVYYGEIFTNARGGRSTKHATQYQALFDLAMSFDLDSVDLPGGFFLLAQNTHGRGLTEDFVGDTLVVSDIDSFDNVMQVGEYWWEFGLLDDGVGIRLGKQDVNTEFLYMDSAVDFIQSSFELTPTATLPTYPAPSMAAVALLQLDESLQLKLGIWDALARIGSWGFSGNGTVLVMAELEYKYVLFDGECPGTLALGAGYQTDGQIAGERLDASHGYYLQCEQLVYRECAWDPCDEQGLGVFAAYYPRFLGAEKLTETIGDSAVAGLVYTGPLAGRDEDVIGAGLSWAELFQGGTNRETVIELFYKARITRRISVQPDLQYIATPSGIHRDALVLGVRCEMTLTR